MCKLLDDMQDKSFLTGDDVISVRIMFCELKNLTFDVARERYLGCGWSIKRIPTRVGKLIDEGRGFTVASTEDRWMIYGTARRDFVGRADSEVHNALRLLLDALLACLGPNIGVGAEYICECHGPNGLDKVAVSYGGVLERPESKTVGHREIKVTDGQVKQVRRIFELLRNAGKNDLIRIPMDFYREACTRRSLDLPWMGIVFLATALEALFLQKNDGDKALEMGRRVADFLSENDRGEDETYREIFALYKSRNAILHDGNHSPVIRVTESHDSETQVTFERGELVEKGFATVGRCLQKVLSEKIVDKAEMLQVVRERGAKRQRPRLKFVPIQSQ